MTLKLEPSSADMLECVAVEIPQVVRKGFPAVLMFANVYLPI